MPLELCQFIKVIWWILLKLLYKCESQNIIRYVHDGKEFYSLVDDEFIDEFGYFMSGSDKGLDMRIWRDTKSQITGSIEL